MKKFLALLIARNKEFYRDRGSLSWALLFPVIVLIGCAIAFSKQPEQIFTVGIFQPQPGASAVELPLVTAAYTKTLYYTELNEAEELIHHHQLDILLSAEAPYRYWINPDSSKGMVLEELLLNQATQPFQKTRIKGRQIRYVDWVLPGILGMNMMFGSLFGVGYVIVRYRKNGVLKRLQATPVTAVQFIAANVFSRLLMIMLACIIILVGSKMLLGLMMIGSYLDLLVVGVLGGLSLITLGLLMSSRTDSEEFAGGLLNATTWPMMFLSGVWFSLENTPDYMQWSAQLLPLTHVVNAARDIMLNGASLADVSFNLYMMTGMTLLYLLIAALLFRWHK